MRILIEESLKYSNTDKAVNKANSCDSKCLSKNLKFWQSKISTIEERPDLCGLLKDEHKKLVHLTEYLSKQCDLDFQSLEDEDEIDLSGHFGELIKNSTIQLASVFNFIWHKLISMYGNSKQTVMGRVSISHGNSESENNLILPVIVDHTNDNKCILDAIKEIQDGQEDEEEEKYIEKSSMFKLKMDSLFVHVLATTKDNKTTAHETVVKYANSIRMPLVIYLIEYERENCYEIKIGYDQNLFASNTTTDILCLLKHILKQVALTSSNLNILKCNELSFLTDGHMRILNEWNRRTDKELPLKYQGKNVHQLFEEVSHF
jgi:hypothetical protein